MSPSEHQGPFLTLLLFHLPGLQGKEGTGSHVSTTKGHEGAGPIFLFFIIAPLSCELCHLGQFCQFQHLRDVTSSNINRKRAIAQATGEYMVLNKIGKKVHVCVKKLHRVKPPF